VTSITKEQVIDILKTVYDPEFRVDIYNLGLIYEIDPDNEEPKIKMTLTTPTCPAAGPIIAETKHKLEKLGQFKVELTFDPPWNPKMITRDGLRMLPAQLVDHLDLDDDFD
jgi:metal-sulfur cluster biosynthetic enzyme